MKEFASISRATPSITAGRNPRLAITGANGHIGRRLVAAALGAGFEVLALVRDEGAASQPTNVTVRRWTLANTDVADMEGAMAICHLAAFTPPNLADPSFAQRCVEDNALGTLRLLEAARAAGVGTFIYASAGQVYGGSDRPARETDPIDLGPRAPYYLGSKLLGEIYCRHAQTRGDMRVVMLRIGSVFGPEMASRATVRRFIDDARAGRTIQLSGSGRYGADFVFVEDVVAAFLAALERPVSGVYNIGSGVRTTIAELATSITRRLGGTVQVSADGEDSPGAQGFAPLDIQKARADLGYAPTPIAEALSRTIES